jgi:hypothetical protein
MGEAEREWVWVVRMMVENDSRVWSDGKSGWQVEFHADAEKGSWEMVAARELRPGEELFLTYGPAYWLYALITHHPDPLVRLLVYSYQARYHPQAFPTEYMYVGEDYCPLLSSTGRVADEDWCEMFLRGFLRLDPDDPVWGQVGVRAGVKSRTRLRRLIRHVFEKEG